MLPEPASFQYPSLACLERYPLSISGLRETGPLGPGDSSNNSSNDKSNNIFKDVAIVSWAFKTQTSELCPDTGVASVRHDRS